MALFEEIYALVRQVPLGKVVTYGEVARALGMKDVRKVGWALHSNRDPETPCHRVVNKEGGLAAHFAFDGMEEQRRRLEAEGVVMKDEGHVELNSALWHFPGNYNDQ
jgi:methylated-DNA-protein-cysteine methyltransferase related protein